MADHRNPGTVDPANQAFPPPPSPVASPGSGAVLCSTGDEQRPAASMAADVLVTGTGLPKSSDGEMQRLDKTAPVSAPPTGLGLPAEVHAGSASQVRTSLPEPSAALPTARDVAAGTSRPGGLPVNVIVR